MSTEASGSFIRIDHVFKSFAGVDALTDVGFSIGRGEAVNLAGENGSGKSTPKRVGAAPEGAAPVLSR